jgi:hypothetical protein
LTATKAHVPSSLPFIEKLNKEKTKKFIPMLSEAMILDWGSAQEPLL